MKVIYCLFIFTMLLLKALVNLSYAYDATCSVDEVVRYSNRVHVRCLERYRNSAGHRTIRYFAAPTSDLALSVSLMNLGNRANVDTTMDTSRLIVTYDPNDESGAAFDCDADNCRVISAVRLYPVGRRANIEIGDIEGEIRTAIVYPSTTSSLGPQPVVLYFHGGGGTAEGSVGVIAFHNLWHEATVVYAQAGKADAAGRPSTGSGWELRFPHKFAFGQRKDLTYVRRLINQLRENYNVDENRIYAAGHSRGGFFTFSLSELMPNTFAAFSVVGAYSRFEVSLVGLECYFIDSNQAARPHIGPSKRVIDPKPFLYIFGRTDDVFNTDTYSMGRSPGTQCSDKSDLVTKPGWSLNADSWARHTLDEVVYRNYGPYRIFKYWQQSWFFEPGPNDDERAAPVQFILHDGGHSWPSDASRWIVSFFKKY